MTSAQPDSCSYSPGEIPNQRHPPKPSRLSVGNTCCRVTQTQVPAEMEQEPFHAVAGCKRTGGSGILWQEYPTPEDMWLLHNRITFGCSRGTAGSHCFFPHLSGIHDSAYSDCQSHGGHFGEVTIKEPGIGQYGVHGQGLHSCPGHQTGSRLVEGDVTVGADTWEGTV